MSKIDIDMNQFPTCQALLKEYGIDNEVDQIIWHKLSEEDAAVALVEMNMMCRAGLSNNINLRRRSKVSANYYHSAVSNSVHIIAAAAAKSEMGISDKRLSELFSHKDKIFGTR